MRYAHFDPALPYTRNLIATDDETFTLLLLCWNPGCESKIHDHPCDGCWLQVLKGEVNECRYKYPSQDTSTVMGNEEMGEITTRANGSDHLRCVADETFVEGQVAFIKDSIGLHKVGNPSTVTPAVTLHLYSPPFKNCRVWVVDDQDSEKSSSNVTNKCSKVNVSTTSCATHYSEYGRIL